MIHIDNYIKKWPVFHSIRGRLLYTITFMLIIIVLLICLLLYTTQQNIRLPKKIVNIQQELSQFYDKVLEMDNFSQIYLYNKTETNKLNYLKSYYNAKQIINNLASDFPNKEQENISWRILLLNNMLQTHYETLLSLSVVNTQAKNYITSYNFLLSTINNILSTRGQYSRLLNDGMYQQIIIHEKNTKNLLLGLLIFGFVLFFVIIFLSTYMMRSITKPLQKIVKNINKIKQGQYNVKEINTYGCQEWQILSTLFTDMAGSIDLYIHSLEKNSLLETRLLEKENENLRINELLVKTELNALQSQMNPHFLFNTLSMLSKLAYIEQAYQTSELMDTVADLMRYSLDKSSKASDLFAELDCIHNYIFIQNKRFSQRINFQVNITDKLENIIMPGMILQPLIENAIVHGVNHMSKNAIIEVKVICDSSYIYISVSDNGIGMSSEALEKILLGKEHFSGNKHTSIGFQNVFKRLTLFFGKQYNLHVYSEPDCGTEIVIALPKTKNSTLKERNNNVPINDC